MGFEKKNDGAMYLEVDLSGPRNGVGIRNTKRRKWGNVDKTLKRDRDGGG
jgi:hypothetical protein